jgi:hypothetical protein
MDPPQNAMPRIETLLVPQENASPLFDKDVFASIPPLEEEAAVEIPCPRCASKLVDPEKLGWCPKCGYCHSLAEGEDQLPQPKPQDQSSSPLGVVEFYELWKKTPAWLKILLGGTLALTGLSVAANLSMPANSLQRALWSTGELVLGLIGLLAAHVWALVLLAPYDEQLTGKDIVIFSRLWSLTLRRLPDMRKQVWLGGWSISAMVCALLVVGGFSYWYQFYNPKRIVDPNLVQAVSAAANAKDKSLEEAVNDLAASRDLPEKKDEQKDGLKVDKRPTVQCAVIGYMLEDDGQLSSLVLATLDVSKIKYAGVVRRGFTPEASTELLARLAPLEQPTPLIPGLKLTAIWVAPEVFCEVHQSGYDESGQLKDANFGNLLDK